MKYFKPNKLVQLSGCRECSLARKEIKLANGATRIIKEICRFGGRISAEEGTSLGYSCNQ